MRHNPPRGPQFYVTAPQPCPYLEGRAERKLFTVASVSDGAVMGDALSREGFRRSQNVLYRPLCENCSACLSARIRVADFTPSRNQRRVLRRAAGWRRELCTAWATQEQFDLFRRYLDHRHAQGGMADMDVFEFAAMIEETPMRTQVVEYRDGGVLVAVCLIDVMDDGLSLVYSFYDPDLEPQSPGTFIILDHVSIAQEAGLPFVYLGYWVPGSPKMGYKARFAPLEVFHAGRWRAMASADDFAATRDAPLPETVTEQVTHLSSLLRSDSEFETLFQK